MDGAAWWAAIYGVAQSWTRLKRLSSIYLFMVALGLFCYIQASSTPVAASGGYSLGVVHRLLSVVAFFLLQSTGSKARGL